MFNEWVYNLVQYNRQMRYQSKPYRSISYAQRESLNTRDLRENKQNNNHLNIPTTKNNRNMTKQTDISILPKVKLQHKLSENTTHSTIISKDQFPQMLKRTYSLQIEKDYSNDILTHISQTANQNKDILTPHNISASLRSKMVDWMIEVLSSYKMTEQTFFRSIYIMDSYLKSSTTRLQVKDLHLVGVTSMFSAGKYEEIHPLKLNVIYDKIARKKFKKSEILDKESEMITILDFKIENASIYDISRHIIQQMKMPLSELSKKYFNKIVLYLSKMSIFSIDLAEEKPKLLAGAVVFIALKTLEQVDNSAQPEIRMNEICRLLEIEEQAMIEVSRKVLDLAKNFSKYYPTLTNLKKFNKFQYGID